QEEIEKQSSEAEKCEYRLRQDEKRIPPRLVENCLPGNLNHLPHLSLRRTWRRQDRPLCRRHLCGKSHRNGRFRCWRSGRRQLGSRVVARMHALHQLVNGLIENFEQRLRINSDPERQRYEWNQRRIFASIQVREMLVRWI